MFYDWPPRSDAKRSDVHPWEFSLNSNRRFLIQLAPRMCWNVGSCFLFAVPRGCCSLSLWFDLLQVDHTLDTGEKPVETKGAGPGQTLDTHTHMFVGIPKK